MEVILALISAAAQVMPEVMAVLPVVEKIIAGQTVTTDEAASVWAAVQALQAKTAATEAAAETAAG